MENCQLCGGKIVTQEFALATRPAQRWYTCEQCGSLVQKCNACGQESSLPISRANDISREGAWDSICCTNSSCGAGEKYIDWLMY